MLNNVVLVGRLVRNPELKKLENDKEVCEITLAVNRSYKNEDGVYETDFITCTLWSSVAKNTCEYCRKGDLLGVKGRLENNNDKSIHLIVDMVTFLSNTSNERRD